MVATRKARNPSGLVAEPPPESVLADFMRRNGCVRLPNRERQREGHRRYKKGYEVRLVAINQKELRLMRRLLKCLQITPGAAYEKQALRQINSRYVLPIYGKETVLRFIQLTKIKMPKGKSLHSKARQAKPKI
jgi:hypothetical protein